MLTGAGEKLCSAECCISCGGVLTRDDIGMTKKLINRGAKQFYCIACLAAYFEVSEAEVRKKLDEFREMGCTLFGKREEDASG